MRAGVLIAGPTASGKSQIALQLAEALEPFGGATIINADSMQVYRDLLILTARPSREDESRVPHRLYGLLGGEERCSAGRWRELAIDAIAEAHDAGQTPILVGGSGLYFQGLTEGLAPVPEIPVSIREQAAAQLQKLGNLAFHSELSKRDPVMAGRIRSSDRQRMVRAWEVLEATGLSLAKWQERRDDTDDLAARFARIVLTPCRQALYDRCDRRFESMVTGGALTEVQALLNRGLRESLPIMKAVGVREIARHLRGELTVEAAVSVGQQATRRYAKRQMTWFRNRMTDWREIPAQYSESFFPEIFSFIRQFLLTP